MSDPESRPTAKCVIDNVDNAGSEIFAFLGKLAVEGERPWCEVHYPAPTHLTPSEKAAWELRQLDTFDAVELVDGQIVTLPPYAELEKGASS